MEEWFLRVGAPSLQPLDERLATLKVMLEYNNELLTLITHCEEKRAAAVRPFELPYNFCANVDRCACVPFLATDVNEKICWFSGCSGQVFCTPLLVPCEYRDIVPK